MDTEWDKQVAKLLVAGDKTHSQLKYIGINDRYLTSEFKRMTAKTEELKSTRIVANDMVELEFNTK